MSPEIIKLLPGRLANIEKGVGFQRILLLAGYVKVASKILSSQEGIYILLDEYDTPINHAYLRGCYAPCRSFLAAMFGQAFKGNDFLESGLITGILKVAKASLFSALNNLKVGYMPLPFS